MVAPAFRFHGKIVEIEREGKRLGFEEVGEEVRLLCWAGFDGGYSCKPVQET
jgi:hypothetical protein